MIEPLTEWLLAASPTKNQAAYEHFWGCCPAGRRSSPPTRTTRSVAPSPPRCRARTPRRPSTPGQVAPWPLAARPTARCARGGRGRRGEGRESSPRAQRGVRLIRDRHRIAAAVTGEVVFFEHSHRRGRGRSPRSALRGCALPAGVSLHLVRRRQPHRRDAGRNFHDLPQAPRQAPQLSAPCTTRPLRRRVRDPRRPVRASNTGQRRMHPHPMSAALGFYARKPVGTPVFVVR